MKPWTSAFKLFQTNSLMRSWWVLSICTDIILKYLHTFYPWFYRFFFLFDCVVNRCRLALWPSCLGSLCTPTKLQCCSATTGSLSVPPNRLKNLSPTGWNVSVLCVLSMCRFVITRQCLSTSSRWWCCFSSRKNHWDEVKGFCYLHFSFSLQTTLQLSFATLSVLDLLIAIHTFPTLTK